MGNSHAITLTSATSCGGKAARSTRPRLIFQPVQTLSTESSSSARNAVSRAVKPRGDVNVLHPLRGVEHDPRSLHHPPGQRHRRCATLKLDTLILPKLDLMPTGPGHEHYFAPHPRPPSHNPQDLRTRPLAAERIRNYGSQYWDVKHESDYRCDGRSDTAYRALHLIVLRDERLIEIQLRTFRQHSWAEGVERVTALSDHDVKEGRAPDDFLEYFRIASDAFWTMDSGKRVAEPIRRQFRTLHQELGRYVIPSAA